MGFGVDVFFIILSRIVDWCDLEIIYFGGYLLGSVLFLSKILNMIHRLILRLLMIMGDNYFVKVEGKV